MYLHGKGELLVPAHLNFGKWTLDRMRQVDPDRTCFQNCVTGDKLRYGEFVRYALRLAAALARLGVARGDTVAVADDEHPGLLPAGLACMLAGAAYTPIELQCGRATLVHKLNITRPKYIICSRVFWDAYGVVLKGLDFIETSICFETIADVALSVESMLTDVEWDSFEPAAVGGDDVALVTYSSGTTGLSKAVLLTHRNCLVRVSPSEQEYENGEWMHTPINVLFSGLITIPYTNLGMYICFSTGKIVLYSENHISWKLIKKFLVDFMVTVPTFVEELLTDERAPEDASRSLRIISAGATLPSKLMTTLKHRFPNVILLDYYGSSETGQAVRRECAKSEAAGNVTRGVTLKIVDVETRAVLGPNQRGEICVRSPAVMKGYLGASAAAPYFDEEGFYLTGDLGYYDDEKRVAVVGRLTDIIVFRAKKICPEEVEGVLLQHEAVRDAALAGRPAGADGERPAAFVVLRPGAAASEQDLVEYVAQQVTWYMRLTGGVRFVAEIPRNASGKVMRNKLREILRLEGDA